MKRYNFTLHPDGTGEWYEADDGLWMNAADVDKWILTLPAGSELKAALVKCGQLAERVRALEANQMTPEQRRVLEAAKDWHERPSFDASGALEDAVGYLRAAESKPSEEKP